jgi:peroxin-5
LANSGHSEDAIASYYKALEIKPTFVRARYNLGVSCINIGCYKEAAEHILGALTMHENNISPSISNPSTSIPPPKTNQIHVSQNLWETLRRAFLMMERDDLVAKAYVGADLSAFRNEFEF